MARAGGWVRDEVHGQVPGDPTSQAAGSEYFSLDVEDVPAARLRPLSLGRRNVSSGTLWSTFSTLCVLLPWCKFSDGGSVAGRHALLRRASTTMSLCVLFHAIRSWWNS